MNTRKWHALLACALYLFAAGMYGKLSGHPVELWRVAFWSMVGVTIYIALSGVFGFDPHRTRIARYASPLVQYVDRWELRLGQATLSMLGCVALAAGLLDQTNFVTAVVSGTLAAWTYFALRLYTGGYGRANLAQRSG
jgi:hypothetical protein